MGMTMYAVKLIEAKRPRYLSCSGFKPGVNRLQHLTAEQPKLFNTEDDAKLALRLLGRWTREKFRVVPVAIAFKEIGWTRHYDTEYLRKLFADLEKGIEEDG